jgi:hypothetical protein
MATTYVDTSALVKRYVAEVGSTWVRRMVARPLHQVLYTAVLTEVEVRSALQRLVREGHLDMAQAQLSLSSLCSTSELFGTRWDQTLQPVDFRILGLTRGESSPLVIHGLIHSVHRRPLCQHSCDNDQCRSLLNDRFIKEAEDVRPSFAVISIFIAGYRTGGSSTSNRLSLPKMSQLPCKTDAFDRP